MQNNKLAYFLVAVVILLWGSLPAITKILLTDLDSFQILFYVNLTSLLILGLFMLNKTKITIIKNYNKKDYFNFFIIGLIGTCLYNLFLFLGLNFSSAQEAFIINYTWPIWIILLSSFIFKDHINFRKILAIILSFIGIVIIATNGKIFIFSQQNLLGNLFALIGAFFYGLFSVLAKNKKYDNLTSMFFYFLFGFLASAILLFTFSNFVLINFNQLIGFIWLGSLATGLSYVIWIKALKIGEISKLTNLIFLTPFVSLIYIYFMLGEKILISSFIGLILIISGIIIQQIKNK